MTERILITGAAGRIGTYLRNGLADEARTLRLLDRSDTAPAGEREEIVTADVTDATAMIEAMRDVSAVVHLAGFNGERPWEEILAINVHGTQVVLDAARTAGVGRVILASSNHAAGYVPPPRPDEPRVPDDAFPRPDTFYGVGKVALEALGSLYHDAYGLDVICLRIGGVGETPRSTRSLSMWLSPGDCVRLFDACLSAPSPGFRVAWGVSDNTRRWVSLRAARELGYEPRDDAEEFASSVVESGPEELSRVGGLFTMYGL